MLFMTAIFYQGLFEFIIQISNPFGDDWIDLPTLHMQAGFRGFIDIFVKGKKDSKFNPGASILL
jgi:hypothetical protein